MISYDELNWKNNKLYHGKVKTGLSVQLDQKWAKNNQYRIKYPDGTLSPDFYNLTRAKDGACRFYQGSAKNNTDVGPEKPMGELKGKLGI